MEDLKTNQNGSKMARNTEIIELYKRRVPIEEIAEEYNLSISQIKRISQGVEKYSIKELKTIQFGSYTEKSKIAESIEELKDTQYKYFLYDSTGTTLVKKAEYVEDLLEKINSEWVKERFESGYSELKYKDYIIRNSFKESFDTSKENSLDCNAAIKGGFSALLKFCRDEDFGSLEKSIKDILGRLEQ